jgi:hypothetical protein
VYPSPRYPVTETILKRLAGGQIQAAQVCKSWRFMREPLEAHIAQQAAQNVRTVVADRIDQISPPGSLASDSTRYWL